VAVSRLGWPDEAKALSRHHSDIPIINKRRKERVEHYPQPSPWHLSLVQHSRSRDFFVTNAKIAGVLVTMPLLTVSTVGPKMSRSNGARSLSWHNYPPYPSAGSLVATCDIHETRLSRTCHTSLRTVRCSISPRLALRMSRPASSLPSVSLSYHLPAWHVRCCCLLA
jgi:hypothetical protein